MRILTPITALLIMGTSCEAQVQPAAGRTTIHVRNREQLVSALNSAQPGTRILLATGTYRGGIVVRNLKGTEGNPVIIASASKAQPAGISGGNSGIQLSGSSFVELRDLEIRDAEINGLNIDDGGVGTASAHHITIRNVHVHDIGDRGNHDGIKLSGVDDFTIADCTIEHWGKSGSGIDMVGCHRGTVTDCRFENPGADNASGVQAKGGSSDIRIHGCRFRDAGGRAINAGGSTGLPYFRPQNARFEAKDITVEDCAIIGSMAPVACVGVDGAVVRFNTIYCPTRWALRILQENQNIRFVPCRNGRFENNIIAFRSRELKTAVNVGSKTEVQTFIFKDNLWFCMDRPSDTRRLIRLPVTEAGGIYDTDPAFIDAEGGNLNRRSTAHGDVGARRKTPLSVSKP